MRLFFFVALTLVVLAVSIAPPANATTWYIKDDGTGDAIDIWTAMNDSAAAGDTILLAAGTYYEYFLDLSDKPLVITSESGPDVTTIDCQNSGHAFYITDFLLTPGYYEISGLTITNGAPVGGAITIGTDNATIRIENNTITNSFVAILTGTDSGTVTIHNNRVSGCTYGVHPDGAGLSTVTNNDITTTSNPGIRIYATNFLVDGNAVHDNSAIGIDALGDSVSGTISNNVLNGQSVGIRAAQGIDQKITVSNNVIFDHSQSGVEVYNGSNDSIYVEMNTLYDVGFGIFAPNTPHYVSVERNIVMSSAAAIFCLSGGNIEYACNDFYFNGASNCGTDLGGNFSEDPLFCDALNDDFGLTRYSPCLDGPCGPVGALGYGGCADERPYITAAEDVGNDQGGQLRLKWERSKYDDVAAGTPVLNYGIYRREDTFFMAGTSNPILPEALEVGTGVQQIPGWDYLMSVPARTDSAYQTIVPTLCDSTVANGDCWSVFFVSATTASPGVFWDSSPDSGYSLDNLDPTPPAFVVEYNAPGGNELTWPASEDPDVAFYNIYRQENPMMTVGGGGGPVHSTTGTSWTDPIAQGWRYSYMMSTVDLSGNESEISTPAEATAIDDHDLPARYALHQNVPNPFNPTTAVRYEVPAPGGRVTIKVYDVGGRFVRTLVDGHVDAGSWSATWDGRDHSGHRVASGVYFIRLVAPGYDMTRKGVLLE